MKIREMLGNVVTLSRIGPFDAAYYAVLSQTLDEWNSADDDEAFRDL